MSPLSKEERQRLMAESNEKQRLAYGDGYHEEMARRQSLRKTRAPGNGGFRWMKENDPERFAQIIADRENKRKNGNKNTPSRPSL